MRLRRMVTGGKGRNAKIDGTDGWNDEKRVCQPEVLANGNSSQVRNFTQGNGMQTRVGLNWSPRKDLDAWL